jgi:hypothetical protein
MAHLKKSRTIVKKPTPYTNIKVVTRNFFFDTIASIQNLVGANLTSYERMIQKAITQITDDMKRDNITLVWYRYEITYISKGAVSVMLYGDKK